MEVDQKKPNRVISLHIMNEGLLSSFFWNATAPQTKEKKKTQWQKVRWWTWSEILTCSMAFVAIACPILISISLTMFIIWPSDSIDKKKAQVILSWPKPPKIGRQTTTQWQWFVFQSFFLLLLAWRRRKKDWKTNYKLVLLVFLLFCSFAHVVVNVHPLVCDWPALWMACVSALRGVVLIV